MHHDRLIGQIIDAEHVHLGQTDEQFTNTDRVALHRGSPTSSGVGASRFSEPL